MNTTTKLATNKSNLETMIAELEKVRAGMKKRRSGLQAQGSVIDQAFASIGQHYGLKAKVTASDDTAGAGNPMPAAADPRALLESILELLDEGISVDDLRLQVAGLLAEVTGGTDAEKMARGLVKSKLFGRDAWLKPSPFGRK